MCYRIYVHIYIYIISTYGANMHMHIHIHLCKECHICATLSSSLSFPSL